MEAIVAQPSSYEFKPMGRKEQKLFRQQIALYIEGIALGHKFEGALLQQGTEASVEDRENAGGSSGHADGGYAGGRLLPHRPRERLRCTRKPKEASEGSKGKAKEVSEGDEWKKEKRKLKEKLDEERSEKEHMREELRKEAELARGKGEGDQVCRAREPDQLKTAAEGAVAGLGPQVDKAVKAAVTSGVSDAAKTLHDVLVETVKGVVNKKLEEMKASIVAQVDKRVREVVVESTKGLKAEIVSMVRDTTRQAFGEAGFAALPSVFGAATALARQGGGGGASGKHPRGMMRVIRVVGWQQIRSMAKSRGRNARRLAGWTRVWGTSHRNNPLVRRVVLPLCT
ncbi:unnamed protein product [Closterium sp. Yama58-4]|nr:unnamed protein product [Closterium sp. Yama58-4]